MKKTNLALWKRSARIPSLQNSLIFLLLAVWIPLPFFNFDEHHDGLILSTIRLGKTALIEGGDYPFNQYGPFWTIPFLVISLIIPEGFLFLGIRCLTVISYFASAYILYKISRLFLNQKHSKVVIILFLGSQPFVSDYGSSLVPWPSGIIMPFILTMSYFSILQVVKTNTRLNLSRLPIYVGFSLPLIILTRLQVGILFMMVSILALAFSDQKNKYLKFSLGFASSATLIIIYLLQFGWIGDAFYDQIIFGSTYLSADKSTFPKPIFTIAGVAFFSLILLLGPTALKNMDNIRPRTVVFFYLAVSASTLVALFYLINGRSISLLSSLVVMTRRFWITSALASLLFLCLIALITRLKSNQETKIWGRKPIEVVLLLLFAISFQSQTYPLFDQMHFWWGSPLTFLVMVIVWKESFENKFSGLASKSSLTAVGVVLLLISVLIPWSAQLSSPKNKLPKEIGQLVYTTQQAAQYQRDLQRFFQKNIEQGARVLNLCDDTNVYFQNNQYVPASRIFVFWGEQMSHAPAIIKSFKESNPEFVVTCGLTHAPALRVSQEKMQQKILEALIKNPTNPISYLGQLDKIWKIYRI